MVAPQVSRALQRFVQDELLRAPMLLDQVLATTLINLRQHRASLPPGQSAAADTLAQALQSQRDRLADYFLHSLRQQVGVEPKPDKPHEQVSPGSLARAPFGGGGNAWGRSQATELALVDEDEVELDVELSHTIAAIKDVAATELLELQTYTSALVGDPDVARDHNPFRAETFARALWHAAQALPLSRAHQLAFLRHARPVLAQLLRMSYAAASSRLESQGVEPAAYRTVILAAGSRLGGPVGQTTFSPDLYRLREAMPAVTQQPPLPAQGLSTRPPRRELWVDNGGTPLHRADRQRVELVARLFQAIADDARVPADVRLLVSRLQGPATRLSIRDTDILDSDRHPLWRYIDRVVYEAEMSPDGADPERIQLLRTVRATVDQLTSEPEQNPGLYVWAMDRLTSYLRKRLARRLSAAASLVGALQKLEHQLAGSQNLPSTMHGTLDVQQLDTVPADLLTERTGAPVPPVSAEAWLEQLQPGDWVRMFLQGRWVQPQLLWPGERREIWLFGDGASDATWAVRRSALLLMQRQALLKSVRQRSIVGSAAARVKKQAEMAA